MIMLMLDVRVLSRALHLMLLQMARTWVWCIRVVLLRLFATRRVNLCAGATMSVRGPFGRVRLVHLGLAGMIVCRSRATLNVSAPLALAWVRLTTLALVSVTGTDTVRTVKGRATPPWVRDLMTLLWMFRLVNAICLLVRGLTDLARTAFYARLVYWIGNDICSAVVRGCVW